MNDQARKRDAILNREAVFANAIGAAVFEKPKVSYWMVLIPILFVYFFYRIQKYKKCRQDFDRQFMTARRQAMELAEAAVASGQNADVAAAARRSGLPDALEAPFAAWLRALTAYYMDLLKADGDTFDALVRSAYPDRTGFLLDLNRLDQVEKDFYTALKPRLAATEGAAEIIAVIQTRSRELRRQMAHQIFA